VRGVVGGEHELDVDMHAMRRRGPGHGVLVTRRANEKRASCRAAVLPFLSASARWLCAVHARRQGRCHRPEGGVKLLYSSDLSPRSVSMRARPWQAVSMPPSRKRMPGRRTRTAAAAACVSRRTDEMGLKRVSAL
jgi:hypothetical protein